MKPARIVVLGIALAAGAIALLARRSDPPSEPTPQVAQAEAAAVLVARSGIGVDVRARDADGHDTAGGRINTVRYVVSTTTIS